MIEYSPDWNDRLQQLIQLPETLPETERPKPEGDGQMTWAEAIDMLLAAQKNKRYLSGWVYHQIAILGRPPLTHLHRVAIALEYRPKWVDFGYRPELEDQFPKADALNWAKINQPLRPISPDGKPVLRKDRRSVVAD